MYSNFKYCRNCGVQISYDARYCRKCGYDTSKNKDKFSESCSSLKENDNYKETFESPYTLTERGIGLFNQRRYIEALECYNKALDTDSRYTWALYNKSLLLRTIGNYSEAEKCSKYADRLRELKMQSGYNPGWSDFKCEICGGDGRESASVYNRHCPRCGKLVCSDCWSYSKMRCKKCKKYKTNIRFLPFILFR